MKGIPNVPLQLSYNQQIVGFVKELKEILFQSQFNHESEERRLWSLKSIHNNPIFLWPNSESYFSMNQPKLTSNLSEC